MPLVTTQNHLMFLHAPKTGGTFVRFALHRAGLDWEDHENQHAGYGESKHLFEGSPRFTIIRNPFDWYASYWTMRQYEGWGGDNIIGHDCHNDDFNIFVGLVCLKHPGFLRGIYKQYEGTGVQILRTETLATDLVNYLLSMGEQFDKNIILDTPVTNPGASLEPYRKLVIYNGDTEESLRESEKEIFDKYNY